MRSVIVPVLAPVAHPLAPHSTGWLPFTPGSAGDWLPRTAIAKPEVGRGTGQALARPAIPGWLIGPVAPAAQRGNIDYDQVRLTARQGDGALFQMYGSVAAVAGDTVVLDSNLNLADAGGPPLIWVTAPSTSSSPGATGQGAYDGSGNLYWCYAANSWARIGPGGYSNSF